MNKGGITMNELDFYKEAIYKEARSSGRLQGLMNLGFSIADKRIASASKLKRASLPPISPEAIQTSKQKAIDYAGRIASASKLKRATLPPINPEIKAVPTPNTDNMIK